MASGWGVLYSDVDRRGLLMREIDYGPQVLVSCCGTRRRRTCYLYVSEGQGGVEMHIKIHSINTIYTHTHSLHRKIGIENHSRVIDRGSFRRLARGDKG
jgi:hypothetical protein